MALSVLLGAAGMQAADCDAVGDWAVYAAGGGNPVISPNPASTFQDPILKAPVHWEALHTFNPAAIVRDGKVFVLYRAEDDSGAMEIGGHTSRLGLAESADGIHFKRLGEPVFYPAKDDQKAREWPGGVEDPRIVEREDGTYVLTYTQWNRKTYSVGIATSRDLTHWTKHGPAFLTAAGGKYAKLKYKSAGIVTQVKERAADCGKNRRAVLDVLGRGRDPAGDFEDLIHWTPVEDLHGQPMELLRPRPGHFDSTFPETGPPPVLTNAGIVVLYNGKNAETGGDPELGPDAYAAGEALFDAHNPAHLLEQTDHPVLKPETAVRKDRAVCGGNHVCRGAGVLPRQVVLVLRMRGLAGGGGDCAGRGDECRRAADDSGNRRPRCVLPAGGEGRCGASGR